MLKRILNIGVSDLHSEILNRKIRISNLIAFLTIVILISFIPLAIYIGSVLSFSLIFFFEGASLLNLYLHHRNRHYAAFCIYTICGFIYFIASTITFGLISNLHYFMLVMCMICVVIFDNKLVLKTYIAFAILTFFFLLWFMDGKPGYVGLPPETHMIELVVGYIVLFLLFIITAIFFIFFKNDNLAFQEKIIHQKEVIEEKNKDITASITYAKRLQEAILPSQHMVDLHLPDSFILYEPKDIVAGDFYWLEAVNMESGERNMKNERHTPHPLLLFAAADCTGHGVPGAMVSVVCSNALNRAIKEFQITEPGKILDKVRELVLETFEKSESEVKDGMDISLMAIDEERTKVAWAGANNPLLLVRDKAIREYKPDKQPIGKTDRPVPFSTQHIDLQKGDILYTFTDGFADQFGGPKGKKFKYSKLKELLISIHSLPMKQQSDKIRQQLYDWKGDLEQVDDILICGIRI